MSDIKDNTMKAQNVTVLIYEDRIKVTITDAHDGAGIAQFTFNSDVDVLRYFTNVAHPGDFSRVRVLLSVNYRSAVAKDVAKALRSILARSGYNVQNSPTTLVRSLAEGGTK